MLAMASRDLRVRAYRGPDAGLTPACLYAVGYGRRCARAMTTIKDQGRA